MSNAVLKRCDNRIQKFMTRYSAAYPTGAERCREMLIGDISRAYK